MAVIPEFSSNLRPHRVIDGEILVETDTKPIKMQLYVGPQGSIFARPVEPPPIDQLGERAAVSPVNRHQGVDQS